MQYDATTRNTFTACGSKALRAGPDLQERSRQFWPAFSEPYLANVELKSCKGHLQCTTEIRLFAPSSLYFAGRGGNS